MELFDLVFPGFVQSGDLKVVKTSFIGKGLILSLPLMSRRDNPFLLVFISGLNRHDLSHGQEVL